MNVDGEMWSKYYTVVYMVCPDIHEQNNLGHLIDAQSVTLRR